MRLSFTVRNYKSFLEHASLNLAARKSDKTLSSALIGSERGWMGKGHLLPAAAIYGANAAGKTNFLLALAYMRHAVVKSQTSWTANTGTRVDASAFNKDQDSHFEIEAVIDDVRYRYGFECTSIRFSKEWLYSYPRGRERLMFLRAVCDETTEQHEDQTSVSIEYQLETGPNFSGDARTHESSFSRTRPNSLYLSSAAQDYQDECVKLQDWFSKNIITQTRLNVGNPDQGHTSILAYEHENFRSLLLPVLRAADNSIKDIVVHRSEVSGDDEDDVVKAYRVKRDQHKVGFIVRKGGKDVEIPFEKQSRGIKRLYSLSASIISALKFGRICIIDELETSMHSHVASQILALFQNSSSNPLGAQLVFTTHETRLLNLQHLRRDQVWFCERDDEGSSTLYSLIEFTPRKDENFELGYLRGRYGAVPRAGIDPSWLAAINNQNAVIGDGISDG